jgi:protein-S-isoprenylcysteine O-methyltransferase Ste14
MNPRLPDCVFSIVHPNLQHYFDAAWMVLGLIWLAGAATAKRTARSASGAFLARHFLLLAVGLTLIFSAKRRAGPLAWRLLPDSPAAAYTGLALTVAGVAFAIWARVVLGGNWSGTVTIKEGHTLVRSGPYRLVRNPIYTGLWLALLGTAVAYGELRGFIGAGIVLLAWWYKGRKEEAFLAGQFGQPYEVYRREVKSLIPFVL